MLEINRNPTKTNMSQELKRRRLTPMAVQDLALLKPRYIRAPGIE
jgi:hypothetical protein